MSKNIRNISILVSCVIILSIAMVCIRFLPDKSGDKENKVDIQPISLIDETIENVRKIEIVNEYGKYVFDKNDKKRLEIEGLNGYPRNEIAYDELGEKVCKFSVDKIVNESVESLDMYGLDGPKVQILIKYSNASTVELLIGNKVPGGDVGYYMMQKDKPVVYLVSEENVTPFLRSNLEYVSTTITSSEKNVGEGKKEIEYIEIMGGNREKNIKIEKASQKNKEYYKIIEPVNKIVTKDGEMIINSIIDMTGDVVEKINITTEDISNYGLDTPFASLKIKYKDADEITILISPIDDSEDYFVMKSNGNIIYRVASYNLEWADIGVEKLT